MSTENSVKEKYNKKVNEVLDSVTGMLDGPEDKFVDISRLVKLARENKYPVESDCIDYIAEAITVVNDEWEE